MGGRTFRFSPSSFHLGSNFSLRRFRITERVSFAIPRVGIYGPTFGLLVSAIMQVGILIPALVNQGVRYSFFWNLRHSGLYEILVLLLPNLIAVGLGPVVAIFDTAFASYLPDKASIPTITNAFMLFGLLSALLAQAVSQSLLPHITMQATFFYFAIPGGKIERFAGPAPHCQGHIQRSKV